MDDSYKTLENAAEGTFREKGSRFLAFGYPVHNENEIKTLLAALRKKYHDARHHCYAYRLGPVGEIYRMNDDGEPSGTAGKPITDSCCPTTLPMFLWLWYGISAAPCWEQAGLYTAYRTATSDMLQNATIIVRIVEVKIRLSFPYDMLNPVMKILKEESLSPVEADYNSVCTLVLKVRVSSLEKITGRIKMISGLQCETLKMDD